MGVWMWLLALALSNLTHLVEYIRRGLFIRFNGDMMLARQDAGSPIGWHEMVVGLRHRFHRRSPSVALLFQRAGLVCAFGDVSHDGSGQRD
jgi:hypothetical protein